MVKPEVPLLSYARSPKLWLPPQEQNTSGGKQSEGQGVQQDVVQARGRIHSSTRGCTECIIEFLAVVLQKYVGKFMTGALNSVKENLIHFSVEE